MPNIVAGSARFEAPGSEPGVGVVAKYALDIINRDNPNVCYVPTATGDALESVDWFYSICDGEDINPNHLTLFPYPNHDDVEKFIMEQDLIWVAGGSVVNLLAVWRAHNLDKVFRQAWESGVVLGGTSAGSLCWSAGGPTSSFGPDLQPFINEDPLLPFSFGVHYDSEEHRRPLFHELIGNGIIPEGYATDDGVALHFVGTSLHKAISDTPGKAAYHVYKKEDDVVEERIEPELLV